MHRWAHCPGSFALGKVHRHRSASVHAARGTVAHDLVEEALGGPDPFDEVLDRAEGNTVTLDGHDILVDTEMLVGVGMMVTYVRERVEAASDDATIWVEQTVCLDGWFPSTKPPPVVMFGRCDVALLTGDRLEIVDYKNGSGVTVNVADNPQLLYYAAGMLAHPLGAHVKHVRLTVVQPNVRSQEKIRHWDVTALDVRMWVDDVLIPAVDRCTQPDAPYVLGDWCGFCPVSHACPKMLEAARQAAAAQFDDQTNGTELSKLLDLAETVATWAETVRVHALARAQDGMNIPGWGVVPTRPRRVWDDPKKVEALLASAGINDFMKVELKSPAQIEKLMKREPGYWAWVEPHIESRSGGVKLARREAPAFDALPGDAPTDHDSPF